MPASPTPRRATLPAWRALAHALFVAIGWIGFVWLWVLVARRPWDSEPLVWLTVGSLLVAPVLTAVWVQHNRSIHRRKGERRAVSRAHAAYVRDWHGRSVHANWAMLAHSPYVTIEVVDGLKRYRGASGQPKAAEAPTASGRRGESQDWVDTAT